MKERQSHYIFLEPQECSLKRTEDHHPLFLCSVSLSFLSTLCNRLLLLFRAFQAWALMGEDRGPQQVENFIPGIVEEEEEEEEEGG